MSRSKHTVPIRVRAPRRVRTPDEPRGHGDASACHELAEVARQVGQRARPDSARGRRPGPIYDRSLELLMGEQGEVVYLEDLECY